MIKLQLGLAFGLGVGDVLLVIFAGVVMYALFHWAKSRFFKGAK